MASFGAAQSSKWDAHYQELVKYKNDHGDCCVSNQCEINSSLARWVKRQRHQYRQKREGYHSTLTMERELALERLDFSWDLHHASWEERIQELHQFRQIHGHCKIPTGYAINPGLALWAKCQRRHFKLFSAHRAKGLKWNSGIMSDKRVLELAKAGFVFNNRTSKGALDILTDCMKVTAVMRSNDDRHQEPLDEGGL